VRGIIHTRRRALIVLAVLIIAVFSTFLFSRIVLQKVTGEDMPEIIRLTLERALVQGEIPAYELIKDKESIVLSTKNIDPNLIPKIPEVNFIFLDPERIQEKAEREGDFLYLRFNQVKIEDFRVLVSLDNTWAVSEENRTKGIGYLCGGGFTIEYSKDFFGRLVSKAISGWIS